MILPKIKSTIETLNFIMNNLEEKTDLFFVRIRMKNTIIYGQF